MMGSITTVWWSKTGWAQWLKPIREVPRVVNPNTMLYSSEDDGEFFDDCLRHDNGVLSAV
jgi:hypothetical protein